MRFVFSVMIIALGLTAQASATEVTNSNRAPASYRTCSCHFGYGKVCSVAVACETEGGYCAGSCGEPRS